MGGFAYMLKVTGDLDRVIEGTFDLHLALAFGAATDVNSEDSRKQLGPLVVFDPRDAIGTFCRPG